MIRGLIAGAVVITAAGCTPTQPISQSLYGEHYYTCCTLRFDEDRNNSDANYAHPFNGMTLPIGTPVTVTHIGSEWVELTPPDQPPVRLFYRFGGERMSPTDWYHLILLPADPTAKLATMPEWIAAAIRAGQLVPGMTRAQAIMARGYPPFHQTPDLNADEWTYYYSRSLVDHVHFKDGVISAIDPGPVGS